METRTRYPHIAGPAALAYTSSGQYLLTTGADNLVRRIVVDSQESQDMLDLEYKGLDIASAGGVFAVVGESGRCELFDVESLAKTATLARTALPLRHAAFSADGRWCAVVGDDLCRLVDTADPTAHRAVPIANVKHLTFHPARPLVVAVSSLDGVLRVLDLALPTPAAQPLAEIEMLLPRITDITDPRSSAAVWSPQGECLAVPNKVFGIALVNTRDWLPAKLLEGHDNAIVHMAFSPNGRYLASAGRDDQVIVWDLAARSIHRRIPVERCLQVGWHPHENQLSCITHERRLHTFAGVVDAAAAAPCGGAPFDALASAPVSRRAAARPADDEIEELFVSDDDGDMPGAAGGAVRENSSFVGAHRELPGRAAALPEENSAAPDEPLFVSERDASPGDGFDDPTLTGRAGKHRLSGFDLAREVPRKRARAGLGSGLGTGLAALQPPFQSGATPWINQRRILCMSAVGYVWSVRHSAQHHSVTISFFDQAVHREVHFQDNDRFDLAAVTAQACVLANSRTGRLAVRFHSSLSDNWSRDLDLAVDGGINCVALSSEVAVVFTKAGYMRAFTLFGSPLAVYRAGGSAGTVVTCAAHNNEVFAVYQQSPTAYTYSLEDVALGTFHQRMDVVEIGPSAAVTSAFFSDHGEPYLMDSDGVLSTLVRARTPGQARWMPVFSAHAGREPDSRPEDQPTRKFWPISVLESKLLCVILRGQQQFPTIPLNLVEEVELTVPGLPAQEAQYLVTRCQFQQIQDRAEYGMRLSGSEEPEDEIRDILGDLSVDLDKMLLRQFQAACSEKRASRGLQIVALVQRPESLLAAAKIAGAYELTNLASRIAESIN